jgi:hypothetical protein
MQNPSLRATTHRRLGLLDTPYISMNNSGKPDAELRTPRCGYWRHRRHAWLRVAWKPPAQIGYNGENTRRKAQNVVTDSYGLTQEPAPSGVEDE